MQNRDDAQLNKLTDEQLAPLARAGKDAFTILVTRYIGWIDASAHNFAGGYADATDLSQEGLMALLDAVRTYSSEKDAKFSTYAAVCIRNRMLSSLKKTKRLVANDESVYADPESFSEYRAAATPESIMLDNEKLIELHQKIISSLSEKEWQVFQLFLTGSAYSRIASQLGVPLKSVDNAMQRIRRKLKSVLRTDC
ncbi:MAG: sigma-70 family RNA polymerase sigma factor [Oscillospiraceae bacterium]